MPTKNMNGRLKYFILLLLLIVVILGIVGIQNTKKVTGDAILKIPQNSACSDQEIKQIWDSIYNETSEGITIIKNESEKDDFNRCKTILAYKNNTKRGLFLLGILNIRGQDNSIKFYQIRSLTAIQGNLTNEYLNNIISLNYPELENTISTSGLETNISDYATNRNIDNETALNELKNIFKLKINSLNTSIADARGNILNYSGIEYRSSDTKKNLDKNSIINSEISSFGNKTFNLFYQIEYNELKQIEGNISNIDSTRINLKIKINNSKINSSKVYSYSTPQKIEFLDDNSKIIKFNLDFTKETLDLTKIKIKKQSTFSSAGYLIVTGINTTKELTIKKKNENSTQVCIKDSEIDSITEISAQCNKNDEYLLNCPGTKNEYSCKESKGKFIVSGLKHSAIKEILPGEIILSNCSSNWSCTNWTTCSNKIQTRTCTDLNNCNEILTLPLNRTCNNSTNALSSNEKTISSNTSDISSSPKAEKNKEKMSTPLIVLFIALGIIFLIFLFILINIFRTKDKGELPPTGLSNSAPKNPPQPPKRPSSQPLQIRKYLPSRNTPPRAIQKPL